MLAASNPQAREPVPAAFKKPLGLIKSYINEKGLLDPEHASFLYVMTAMGLSN